MKIHLKDIEKNISLKLELKPEYSVPGDNKYVILIARNIECQLENNVTSKPYNEYYIRKVSHIVSTNVNYNGENYNLVIGFYFSGNQMTPFLITQYSEERPIFELDMYNEDIEGKEHVMFDYTEYLTLCKFGNEKLSLNDFVLKLVHGEIENENYKLYSISNSISKEFLTDKGLNYFFDEEQRRRR